MCRYTRTAYEALPQRRKAGKHPPSRMHTAHAPPLFRTSRVSRLIIAYCKEYGICGASASNKLRDEERIGGYVL